MTRQREAPILIVRKKVYKGGHHGGAWKVAFADFMTALMALFLVLWIVGQSTDVRSAIAGYFQDPLGRAQEFGHSIVRGTGSQTNRVRSVPQNEILEMRMDRLERLGRKLQVKLLDSLDLKNIEQYIEIRLVDDGLRIELIENETGVFFELGSTTPSKKGREVLGLIGGELATLPNPVVVEGHTDAKPYHLRADYSNWELSTDRANVARRILTSGGLPDSQIDQVRGFADRSLRKRDDPFSASNRRVTITMLLNYNLADEGEVVVRLSGS